MESAVFGNFFFIETDTFGNGALQFGRTFIYSETPVQKWRKFIVISLVCIIENLIKEFERTFSLKGEGNLARHWPKDITAEQPNTSIRHHS